MPNNPFKGRIPAKAIVIKIIESAVSPIRVDKMALTEKSLPFISTLTLLITKAFRNDPVRYASKLAVIIRGVLPRIVEKAS